MGATWLTKMLRLIKRGLGPGVFPHQFSFLLELPLRRLVLSRTQLANRIPADADFTVLEIGCGSGYYSEAIAALCARLVSVDLQPEMVRKTSTRLIAAKVSNVRCVTADARALPFERSVFDAACMVAVFGEIPEQGAVLSQIHRILKADGILSITEHLPDPDFQKFSKLAAVACEHGFVLERRWGPPWAYTANFKKVSAI